MKFFGYFMGIVIFLFGILTLIAMIKDGVDSSYSYIIPSLFIIIGILFISAVKYEKNDTY